MSERLEKIKEIDISPLCFYLNEMTNFDGKLLKGYWKWLIKQAERVEELEETNKKLIESTTVVANENHRYKLALEFYAHKKNYDLKQLERDKHVIPIFEDKGKKARQALESDEN